jgi:hypothetical protein
MSKQQYGGVLVVAMVAGLVGGMVSNWFLIGSFVFAQKAPRHEKVLQAERFEVIDQDGKFHAVLGATRQGDVSLLLNDRNGQPRIQLSVLSENSGLVIYDQAGKIRAEFDLTKEQPSLQFYDPAQKFRVLLGVIGKEPALWLFDQAEKPLAKLDLSQGEPSLELSDHTGKARATLGYTELEVQHTGSTEKRAVSSLVLFDKDGKVTWAAP